LDTGDSQLSPPFFVCYPDTYHPRSVISYQAGSSCFPLLLDPCYLQDAGAPAPISPLIPSDLPAVIAAYPNCKSLMLLSGETSLQKKWGQSNCFRPATSKVTSVVRKPLDSLESNAEASPRFPSLHLITSTLWDQRAKLLSPWDFPDENTGVGGHFLLQGIFLTQGSNASLLNLLHWRADSHCPTWEP